jgi:hypothetical protein
MPYFLKMIKSELLKKDPEALVFSWETFGGHPLEEEFWRLVLDGRTAKTAGVPRVMHCARLCGLGLTTDQMPRWANFGWVAGGWLALEGFGKDLVSRNFGGDDELSRILLEGNLRRQPVTGDVGSQLDAQRSVLSKLIEEQNLGDVDLESIFSSAVVAGWMAVDEMDLVTVQVINRVRETRHEFHLMRLLEYELTGLTFPERAESLVHVWSSNYDRLGKEYQAIGRGVMRSLKRARRRHQGLADFCRDAIDQGARFAKEQPTETERVLRECGDSSVEQTFNLFETLGGAPIDEISPAVAPEMVPAYLRSQGCTMRHVSLCGPMGVARSAYDFLYWFGMLRQSLMTQSTIRPASRP